MSATQTFFGTAILVGIGSFVVDFVTPDLPPIVVHSLEYSDGTIHQARTVTTDADAFFATWRADLLDEDGEVVCTGGGSWNYRPGFYVANLELSYWVGDDSCTADSLEPGTYTPFASWFWGEDQTSAKGEPFTIEEPTG